MASTTTGGVLPLDDIKRLTALEVGQRLGILTRDVANPDTARYAFRGATNSTWLQFFPDGRFHNHRNGHGGSGIDLVLQFLGGAPDWMPDQSRFREACERIATEFGIDSERDRVNERSRVLATTVRSSRLDSPDALAKLFESRRGPGLANLEEAERLIGSLGLPVERVSIARLYHDGAAYPAFMPAVPWLGTRILRKPGANGEDVPGGWSMDAAKAYFDDEQSGRIFVLDLDGYKPGGEHGDRLIRPGRTDLERLLRTLERSDIPPAAVVLSSVDDEGGVKAHIYFVGTTRAGTIAERERWYDLLARTFASKVERLFPAERAATFATDPGPRGLSRIMRLPGFPKPGRPEAAVVLCGAGDSDRVDFPRLVETRPIAFTRCVPYKGNPRPAQFELGAVCRRRFEDESEDAWMVLGSNLWPLRRCLDVEGDQPGIRLRYHDIRGHARYEVASIAALTNGADQAREAQRLAAKGVQVSTGHGQALMQALGYWADRDSADPLLTVSRPGWHRTEGRLVYVNGETVCGANWSYVGPPTRSQRAGSLEDWISRVQSLARTPAAIVALGCAFAPPLLELLGYEGFGVHLSGPSSSGKTLCAKLAQSVWGRPSEIVTWNGTANGLEFRFSEFNDALVVFDEIKEASPAHVARLVHAISDGVGRTRSNQSGTAPLATRRWRVVVLSTGENSVAEVLGAEAQGGQAVRMVDINVGRGDACHDAEHAEAVRRFLEPGHFYGTAGDAWVKHICEAEGRLELEKRIEAAHGRLQSGGTDPELGRILRRLALVEVALHLAHGAELLPGVTPEVASTSVDWAARMVRSERGKTNSPERRALELLHQSFLSNPNSWPSMGEYPHCREAIGIRCGPVNDSFGQVWICEGMLKACGLLRGAGVSARRFLSWAKEQPGLVLESDKTRVAGLQAHWHKLDFSWDG